MKADPNENSFYYGRRDVLSGDVDTYYAGCPGCLIAPMTVVDGYVKAVEDLDNHAWLMEVLLIREFNDNRNMRDTVFTKQYFKEVEPADLNPS